MVSRLRLVVGTANGFRRTLPQRYRPRANRSGWRNLDASLRGSGAAGAVRSHPRFQEAVRIAIGGLIESFSHKGLLSRVLNDRGRVIGGLGALYLHFAPAPGDKEAGLTVGRFQALCAEVKLCSPGRARAVLALMRYAGYLAPAPGRAPDRRQRRLVPTERLIELHRQRWRRYFEAMALVMPEEGRKALEIHGRPEFTAAFVRHLGAMYLAGFRPLHHAPDLERLIEKNAGLLVIVSLFLAATDGGRGGAGRDGRAGLDIRAVRAVRHRPRPRAKAARGRGRGRAGEADQRERDRDRAAPPRPGGR